MVIAKLVVGMGAVEDAHAGPSTAGAANPAGLTLPDVEPKGSVRSTVPLAIGVEVAWAKQQLQGRIPEQLHQASNREVAPGVWLDAKVTRGAIDFRIRDNGAIVSAPIDLHLDVRSKLGPLLMHWGQCRSTIDFELELNLKLTGDGRLNRPTAKATLREPCRLSGFDATPFLQREIERNLAMGEAQMSEHLSRANDFVAGIHAEFLSRLSKSVSGCLRFVPEKLRQTPIGEEQGVAVTRLIVDGVLANSCDLVPPASIAVESATVAQAFDLAWSRRVNWSELREFFVQHLAAKGLDGTVVKVRAVRHDDTDQLALFVRLPKRKGWVFVEPRVGDNGVVFRVSSAKDARLRDLVRPTIEAALLPVDTTAVERLGRQILQESQDATLILGQNPDLKQRFQVAESEQRTSLALLLEPDGLVVVVHRTQSAR